MFSMKEEGSILNHVSFTFGSRAMVLFLSFLTGVIVARTLGPAGKGLLAVIAMVGVTVVNLGNLGIRTFNTYIFSNENVEKNSVISNSFWAGLIIGIIFFIILSVLALNFPIFFRNIPRSYLLLYLVSLPFLFWSNFFQGILIGEQKFRKFNIFIVIAQTINLVGGNFIIISF